MSITDAWEAEHRSMVARLLAESYGTEKAACDAADSLALTEDREVYVYQRVEGPYRVTFDRPTAPIYTAAPLPF